MSAALYWLAIKLYTAVSYIAALFNPKARKFVKGRQGLLRQIHYALIDERRPRIWMHCASLGEFEQGRPVLEKLRAKYPHYAIILTFFSPSGYEVRKKYEGADHVLYLPMDSVHNAKAFLKAVQPAVCIFVKYEFWYFFLMQIARQNIPSILISAIFRKRQPFFKWYGWLHRRMLKTYAHIFVQDAESMQLLERIGISEISVAGDTRFDRVVEAIRHKKELPIADSFCNGSRIIVAGSTWREDEKLLHEFMQKSPTGWKLILVPHEVDTAHISEIESLFGNDCIKWTDWKEGTGARVLIVNKVGLLLQLYRFADIAMVGGGFGKDGVHNVLEAAIYSVPVIYGPVYHQFLEAKELLAAGGSSVINDASQFLQLIEQSEQDTYSYEQTCKAAEQYVMSKTGATSKILAYLDSKNWLKTP